MEKEKLQFTMNYYGSVRTADFRHGFHDHASSSGFQGAKGPCLEFSPCASGPNVGRCGSSVAICRTAHVAERADFGGVRVRMRHCDRELRPAVKMPSCMFAKPCFADSTFV